MKRIISFLMVLLISSTSWALWINRTFIEGYDTALVILDRGSGTLISADPALGARRLTPCSTFKIYNTLIGLELGLLGGADEPWYRWDGVQRDIEAWNSDLSLREAFRVSCVPAFQDLARQVGREKMEEYIKAIGYGSMDISSGLDTFWLPRPGVTSITISADEQVELLSRFLDGGLPFSEKNAGILKDIMLVEKTEKGALYGKTGSSSGPDGKPDLGWFVGFLESGDNTYVFACNITNGEEPSGKTARKIVEAEFRDMGVL